MLQLNKITLRKNKNSFTYYACFKNYIVNKRAWQDCYNIIEIK